MGANKMQMQSEMEMVGLCDDLVGEILDRLSIKEVTRMKCLSSRWHGLVSRYRRSRPRTSSSMFFCRYQANNFKGPDQIMILNAREQQGGSGVTMHEAVSSPVDRKINFMGSSNGLLLFRQSIRPFKVIAYVCNPRQKQWQWDTLPTLYDRDYWIETSMSLAYDGVPDHPYKVISYIELRRDGKLKFAIYSSNTREWRKDVARIPQFSRPRRLSFFDATGISTPHLFFKGWILCIISDVEYFSKKHECMLVYNIQKNFFKRLNLPRKDGCFANGFLCISEGGLHYCQGFKHGFHLWKYADDIINDLDGDDESYLAKWKLKHTADITNLITQHPEICGPAEHPQVPGFDPCAFDEDLQILYIKLRTSILSYSFETQRLEKIWTYKESGDMGFSIRCLRSLSIPFNGEYYLRNDSILSLPEALPDEYYRIILLR